MAESGQPYNPLDRVELGKSVERALLARPLVTLAGFLARRPQKFPGAGLYALYYVGPLEAYADIAPPRREPGDVPIYVGRARPPGARQGALGLESTASEPVLFDRLREHARSIDTVEKYADEVSKPDLATFGFPMPPSGCRRYLGTDGRGAPNRALPAGVERRGGWIRQPSSWRWTSPTSQIAVGYPAPGPPLGVRSARLILRRQADPPAYGEHLARWAYPDLDTVPVVDEEIRRALAEEPGS